MPNSNNYLGECSHLMNKLDFFFTNNDLDLKLISSVLNLIGNIATGSRLSCLEILNKTSLLNLFKMFVASQSTLPDSLCD